LEEAQGEHLWEVKAQYEAELEHVLTKGAELVKVLEIQVANYHHKLDASQQQDCACTATVLLWILNIYQYLYNIFFSFIYKVGIFNVMFTSIAI
jgi:hypothetical protein